MKKSFKYYLIVWLLIFVLFNVVAFFFGGIDNKEKYTTTFWIGYVFITLCVIGHLIISFKALNTDNAKRTFYNIPIIRINYIGLIFSFIVGVLCMVIKPLPYWIGIIVCVLVLVFDLIAVIKAKAAAEIAENIDDKTKTKKAFIKSLTIDAKNLIPVSDNAEIKQECQKVYELIKFSDPMSNKELNQIETDIYSAFNRFNDAVVKESPELVKALSKELTILINKRNDKCKGLK